LLRRFSLTTHDFTFKKTTFRTFDRRLVETHLGKSGNQTAINTAGSTWKKTITRYGPPKVSYRNTAYDRLLNFLEQQMMKQSSLINDETFRFREIDVDDLRTQRNADDIRTLHNYEQFRDVLRDNLRKFKTSRQFRVDAVNKILTPAFEFKKDIPPEYAYIVLSLYIAKTYPQLAHRDYARYLSSVVADIPNFLTRYYEALIRDDDTPIENLTCFCYTQYFWFDWRLTDSPESEIHSIIFGMFAELKIHAPTPQIEKIDAQNAEIAIRKLIPDATVDFPIPRIIQQVQRAKQKVTAPRPPRIFDMAKELSLIAVGTAPSQIKREGSVSVHPNIKMHAPTDLKLCVVDGEELYLPPEISVEEAKKHIASAREFRKLVQRVLGLWPIDMTRLAHLSIEPVYRDAHHEKDCGIIFNITVFEQKKPLSYWIWTTARELTYARFGRLTDMTLPFMRDLVVLGFRKAAENNQL